LHIDILQNLESSFRPFKAQAAA